MNRLTKVAHFIHIKRTNTAPQLAELYSSRMVCLHGVPMRIEPGIGTQLFQSYRKGRFQPWLPIWNSVLLITLRLRKEWESKSDSQGYAESLCCAVQKKLEYKSTIRWVLLQQYQSRELKMAPFEMLYGHRCQTPLFWSETRERKFLDPTYCRKPRNKIVWWGRTCGLCNQDRRAMPTIGEENLVSKLEIMCTSRCHLWQVYDISSYEAISHLGSLIHSRSQRWEKKNWR
jgi:hypothetical protein